MDCNCFTHAIRLSASDFAQFGVICRRLHDKVPNRQSSSGPINLQWLQVALKWGIRHLERDMPLSTPMPDNYHLTMSGGGTSWFTCTWYIGKYSSICCVAIASFYVDRQNFLFDT